MLSKKILIIDNDERIQFAFHSILQKEGYESIQAMNGSAALKLLAENKFWGIFLEIDLPGTDGLKILELINNLGQHLPVVIITGLGTPRKIRKAMELGAIEFLEKPFSLASIREVLQKIKLHNN